MNVKITCNHMTLSKIEECILTKVSFQQDIITTKMPKITETKYKAIKQNTVQLQIPSILTFNLDFYTTFIHCMGTMIKKLHRVLYIAFYLLLAYNKIIKNLNICSTISLTPCIKIKP